MADDQPSFRDFGSTEALVSYIKERSDDLEIVVVPTRTPVLTYRGEAVADLSKIGMLLYFIGGGREMIVKSDAEVLPNDGILNRMKIKIELGG
jgi:hypothetical protein